MSDNVALDAAAHVCAQTCIAFNVDPGLLAGGRIGAPIVHAFFTALAALRDDLRSRGSDLVIVYGDPLHELPALAERAGANAVFFNEDYDPSAIARDTAVESELRNRGIAVHRFLDHVCLGTDAVRSDSGAPYKVYSPFARRWRDRYRTATPLPVASQHALAQRLLPRDALPPAGELPDAATFGFTVLPDFPASTEALAAQRLEEFLDDGPAERYGNERDVPGVDGTSRLSYHLRAGTIGIRTCFARAHDALARNRGTARASIEKWISELIWREFYQTILALFPHVDGRAFRPEADRVPWLDDRDAFAAWCEGRTGYPIVDAAMRQLNTTGWMHNRLRMIVASFLTKDLLIDWRWGERYFEQHLADADLAQNNGGWQWAASTGADAAPYFRIFNPVTQGKKFDPAGAFVRRMIPELDGVPDAFVHDPWNFPLSAYPPPIVDHDVARKRALAAFAAGGLKAGEATR